MHQDNRENNIAEPSEDSVAALIGRRWTINVGGAWNATVLCIDWANEHIYSEDQSDRRGTVTPDEAYGHVTVYELPEDCSVTPDYLLHQIAARATRIAEVAQGYDSEWDGRNHVAEFEEEPYDLFEELSDYELGDEGVYERWDADEWLSEPYRTLDNVYKAFGVERSRRLRVLVRAILSAAEDEHVALDEDDVEAFLQKFDE